MSMSAVRPGEEGRPCALVNGQGNLLKTVITHSPPPIPRTNAVIALATAISIPNSVAVRKKTLGLIKCEDMGNARPALNGTPPDLNDSATGIAG